MIRPARPRPFRVTLIYPCVGRHAGMRRYIRTWLLEPMPPAMLAALAPDDVELRFYDDRLEPIPYDEPTDLVAITVETYTARRSYQIASAYRKRGVPVVMGGFHVTLCPDEAREYAESIVIGEAEELFAQVIDDCRHGTPRKTYQAAQRPAAIPRPDRSILRGKRYQPLRLIEFGRGCPYACDFCTIQAFFRNTQVRRDVDQTVAELRDVTRPGQLVFFIDDNIISDIDAAKALFLAIAPLKLRWVSQCSIHAAFDEELLELMRRSGCNGVLIGLESLSEDSLRQMNKPFNLNNGGIAPALHQFNKHRVRVFGSFVFGYDHDTPQSFLDTLDLAKETGLFLGFFNHVMPFPGTPLYARLEREGRLRYEAWWRDGTYRYNMVPFNPTHFTADELAQQCLGARRAFYGWPSILQRARRGANLAGFMRAAQYFVLNVMHHSDVDRRSGLPLGDETWQGPLIKAC